MKYRKFGLLDWNVSEIGLGCWQIGADWGEVSEDKAKEVLKSSFENGVNFLILLMSMAWVEVKNLWVNSLNQYLKEFMWQQKLEDKSILMLLRDTMIKL